MDRARSAKAAKRYCEEEGGRDISRSHFEEDDAWIFHFCWPVGLFVGIVFSYGT